MEPEGGLQRGESVKTFCRPSPWQYSAWYVLGVLLMPFMFLGLPVIIIAELHRRGNRFYVTSDRVIREFRFLSRNTEEATFDLVTDISIDQSLVARSLNLGNVNINTASGEVIEFTGVKNPKNLKNILTKSKHRERNSVQQVEMVNSEGTSYCPDCGEKVSNSSKFCSNCGHRLESSEPNKKPDTEKVLKGSIPEVKDDVRSMDSPDIENFEQKEKNGKNRKTLLDWLEKQK